MFSSLQATNKWIINARPPGFCCSPPYGQATAAADWVALAVSLAAFLVATMSYIKSSAAARAQVFLELRKRFSELKASIPVWYNEATIPDSASADDLRAVELYWQNAFDEWFITNKLERWHLRKLWNRFYKGTLTLALSNGALRQAAANLTHGGPEFGEHQDEFRATLNALCRRAYNEPLCGKESCPNCGSAAG